jgi:hypothetical protein
LILPRSSERPGRSPVLNGACISITQNVAAILKQHITLEVEGIDRMYLSAHAPRLQGPQDVVSFFQRHLGEPVASSSLMAPRTQAFVAAMERFVNGRSILVAEFRKGPRPLCQVLDNQSRGC